jgi:tRNA (guanine37-N1)-methyltransferase
VNESFSQETTSDLSRGIENRAAGAEPRISGRGILDYPHYTRPQKFRDWAVPEVLMSGNHEEIRRWRRQKALEKTLRNRPELLDVTAQESEKLKG